MRLWLIRHGETQHNIDQIFQGQLDTPLTARGVAQARETARALASISFDRIIASDLERAADTAKPLEYGRGLKIERDVRLRELHYGILQGVQIGNFRQILDAHGVGEQWGTGVFSQSGDAPPGGESLEDLVARTTDLIMALDRSSALGDDVACVSHGGTIRTIMTTLLDMPAGARGKFRLSNCGVSRFSRDEHGWTLDFHNRVYWDDQ